MKRDRAIYWTTTGIIAVLMLWSSFNFAFSATEQDAFRHLGLPNWFRLELTIAKVLGAFALLLPATPQVMKEFAYFGFALTLVSAEVAHQASGDSIALVVRTRCSAAAAALDVGAEHVLDEPAPSGAARSSRPSARAESRSLKSEPIHLLSDRIGSAGMHRTRP